MIIGASYLDQTQVILQKLIYHWGVQKSYVSFNAFGTFKLCGFFSSVYGLHILVFGTLDLWFGVIRMLRIVDMGALGFSRHFVLELQTNKQLKISNSVWVIIFFVSVTLFILLVFLIKLTHFAIKKSKFQFLLNKKLFVFSSEARRLGLRIFGITGRKSLIDDHSLICL